MSLVCVLYARLCDCIVLWRLLRCLVRWPAVVLCAAL